MAWEQPLGACGAPVKSRPDAGHHAAGLPALPVGGNSTEVPKSATPPASVGDGLMCLSLSVLVVGLVLWSRSRSGGGRTASSQSPGPGYQRIRASFRSSCPRCDNVIEKDAFVWWKKGEKAIHLDCAGAAKSAEELRVADALDKMSLAKGPAKRRHILAGLLAEVSDPDTRAHLLLEASKIEVEAVLGKADKLKTPAAKRRLLEEALEVLRMDDVPDELQEVQIRWLQEALADLEREVG